MTRRRGSGEGHIKKITLRSGATAWRGWLTVGYRANGTPIRRTLQRRTRDEVRAGLARLREKYQSGIDLAAERMRLDTLLDKWLEHWKATAAHKKRTPTTYAWAIARIKAGLGNPLVASVTPLRLQTWLNAQADELKKGSLGLLRVVLSGAFRQAQLWRIRPDNPAQGLKLPRVEADERRIITMDQAQQLLQELTKERLGLAVALTFVTAMRPGEVAALKREDIDLSSGLITIKATHTTINGEVSRDTPKTKRGYRTIRLVAELRPWVTQHLEQQTQERAAMGERWPADEGLLFVSDTGTALSNYNLYHLSRRVAERVGLGKIGPRILRRSMLSYLAHAGVGPKVRAALGGHTPDVTEQSYHEIAQSETDAAIELIRPSLTKLQIPSDSASNAGSNADET